MSVISITSSWQQQAAQVEHVMAVSVGIVLIGMRVDVIGAQCMSVRVPGVDCLTSD